ncbi:MAG: hypothetical protein WC741_04270 [Patescibacteria group bacterium]|jgi:hypothetical protein
MKKTILIAVVIFVLVNLFFNFQSWQEILVKKTSYNIVSGDSTLSEFILENNYQRIKSGKNPFILEKKLFYPFTINVALSDPGSSNVIFFFLFRPFLGIHESMLLVVLINIFLANFFMFLVLRKFKISGPINVLLSLSFGFMPVIAYRVFGHYTYTSIYVFPLMFFAVFNFIEAKKSICKISMSILIGLLMMFILLLSFYYFIGVLFCFFFYFTYYLIFFKKQTIIFIIENFKYFLLTIISFFIFIIPWLYSVFQLIKLKQLEKTQSFGGAIDLSGDLASFFIPSEYNPFYKMLITKLSGYSLVFSKLAKLYFSSTQKFIYPGLIILFSYISIVLFKKKLPLTLWKKIKIHFFISLLFAVILLGPFLKVFNRWYINLDGVAVLFPLPFLLIHYLPGLSSVRASTRFTPLFIFLAVIVSAHFYNYLYEKIGKKNRIILISALIIIFFFDQYAVLPKQPTAYFPMTIYKYLKISKIEGTVFEIPFTVRDGFSYLGFIHAIGPMNGQLIHGKPIIGGYFPRINSAIFKYYRNKKFINYVAAIIDKGNFNPLKEKPGPVNIFPYGYSTETIKQDVIDLNIKYIILKEDERYSQTLNDLIKKVGFRKTLEDNSYSLYEI